MTYTRPTPPCPMSPPIQEASTNLAPVASYPRGQPQPCPNRLLSKRPTPPSPMSPHIQEASANLAPVASYPRGQHQPCPSSPPIPRGQHQPSSSRLLSKRSPSQLFFDAVLLPMCFAFLHKGGDPKIEICTLCRAPMISGCTADESASCAPGATSGRVRQDRSGQSLTNTFFQNK